MRQPLPVRLAAFVRALPDHALLDRIIRGRVWIPLLGVLLAGIVAMQVEVLKLSATMGRTIERGTALESRNEQLRTSVAEISDVQRIERLAAAMGMVMPAPAAVNFLGARSGGDVQHALANIHPASASGFIAALPAIDTPAGLAAANAGFTASSTTSTAGTTSTATALGTTAAGTTSTPTAPGTIAAVAPSSPPATVAATVPATVAPSSTSTTSQQATPTGASAVPTGG